MAVLTLLYIDREWTTVGILTFVRRINFMLRLVEHDQLFKTPMAYCSSNILSKQAISFNAHKKKMNINY